MTANALSKEEEIRLIRFFNETVEPKVIAKAIRQLNYTLALSVMRENETLLNKMDKLEDSFYWLNELAEILNPYLETE